MADAIDPRLQSINESSSATSVNQQASNSQNTHGYSQQFAHQAYRQTNDAAPRHYQPQSATPLTPSTPHSASTIGTNNITPAVGTGTFNARAGEASEEKRQRACEKCRELKVKCIFERSDGTGPCKRCQKANRQCVVTEPVRKRQKKDPDASSSKVLELERKIDALTAALSGREGSVGTYGGDAGYGRPADMQQYAYEKHAIASNSSNGFPIRGEPRPNRLDEPKQEPGRTPTPLPVAGAKRAFDTMEKATDTKASFLGDVNVNSGDNSRRHSSQGDGRPKHNFLQDYTDVIERGMLSEEGAEILFRCYVEQMAIHMPAVVFSAGTAAAQVRKEKPFLFLAILSASCGSIYPQLQKALTQEIMDIYADRIICHGHKSLELVQALLVNTLWYFPPDHFEELKFYQLIHIAAVMAMDIGLGSKSRAHRLKDAGLLREGAFPKSHPWRRTPHPDSETLESRRTWLACYFICCNAAVGLRRPNLIRWTSFMADSIEVLSTSPEAEPTDRVLALWVQNQHIAEEVGTQFAMDDPNAQVSIADAKVQYALKGFERDLERWSAQIPSNIRTPCLTLVDHVVNLYMHEVAMHVNHNIDEFKPPFTEASLQGVASPQNLTSAHIDALSTCLKAIDGVFDTFLGLHSDVIRCLPVLLFVRVAYAMVVLIKMYFAAALQNSELGKIINTEDMKVEKYLDDLVKLYTASAEDEKSRPAAKFLKVLFMLKTWFYTKRDGKPLQSARPPVNKSTQARKTQLPRSEAAPPPNAQQPSYNPASTGLRMLSEVATGNSDASHSGHPPHHDDSAQAQYSEWQQAHAHQQQQYGYDVPMNQMPPPVGYSGGQGFEPAPFPAMELGHTAGDDFEQAIGMTMGFSDFGNYFGPGGLFGGAGFDGM